ncbi:hypothetical protein NC653_015323 [Populus alba x Populus x berolinensis]|uniref:Uncharacterized protein n=1 Tax=Populus alba x Populus x berolinensis TaxID=444605 RepID=A0AAD6VYB9_9ROSI|nr:hypothetical protein NC653_015323 [Populus alba x Populus x berolinensis]
MLLGARRKKISMLPDGLPSSVTVADFLVIMVLVTTRFSVFRKLLGHQISYVHHVKEHDETTFFPESHYNLTLSFAFVL